MKDKVKIIAIHLPQFYPFKENNNWWGKGFTEWTNVVDTQPKFKSHYQPHLPADLGFYDLRLEEARLAQETLAKEYEIYGFCYYHYWFNGKQLLNEPVERKLKNFKEDLPFMLCWANETWSRTWTGKEKEILIAQSYSLEDHKNHIQHLIKNIFKDERYIKIDNKPFVAIYRPSQIPVLKEMVNLWEEECKKAGFNGIHLAYMMSEGFKVNPSEINFNASIEFKPDFISNPPHKKASLIYRILSKLKIYRSVLTKNHVIDYNDFVKHQLNLEEITWKNYKGVTPMWDNSARRKNTHAFILHNSTPEGYQNWLENVMKKSLNKDLNDNFIFINAWNEWAEGNHLEPCKKWGLRYLEATKNAIQNHKH